jgi:plastocyanin
MRHTTWIAAAALFSLAACGGVTSPSGGGGGGPAGHVTVGNIFFRSAHNGSANPAVDTIAAGDSITWTWNAAGSHSIQSTGVPDIFRNSVVMSGANDTYKVTFRNPGTYTYDCAVHGSAMTGRIVVQ